MKKGTHNSGTGGKLRWWLSPFAWVINSTSKCQSKNIPEQLADGVKVFNIQVSYIRGTWRFTHGLAVYNEDLFETLGLMKQYANREEPIFFQLYLDKCFWCKKAIRYFIDLVEVIKKDFCNSNLIMLVARIEGSDIYLHRSDNLISIEEHYWSLGWAKTTKKWYNYIPIPERHARKYNEDYKKNCRTEYLMLDYYELG